MRAEYSVDKKVFFFLSYLLLVHLLLNRKMVGSFKPSR